MNENSDLITSIKEYDIKFYLFGSVLSKENPNDIDLLMVYNPNLISLKSVVKLKNKIINYLDESPLIKVDLLLLSMEEESEIDFIKSEKALNIEF